MPKRKRTRQPYLGIFWLVGKRLVVDKLPLSEAQRYADHLIYPRGHNTVWNELERAGQVRRGSEYDEYPRGRVAYHPDAKEFTVLADECILGRKVLVDQIKKSLNLKGKMKLGSDPHYRCPKCIQGKKIDEESDDA